MSTKLREGQRVRAKHEITESGKVPGDPKAKFPASLYIHAAAGDVGVVEGVDGGEVATVRFERTGTATIVGDEEVSVIPSDVENMA
jgi:hypothetical protein